MKNLILSAAVVMLSACEMRQGGMYRKSGGGNVFGDMAKSAQETRQYVDETVQVVTDPAGASVQVNDGFVGYSPVKTMVRRYWNGEPGSMVLDTVKIDVAPAADGQCAQGGVFGEGSRKLPVPVRFSMTNCPEGAPAYEPVRARKKKSQSF